jgi:dienelactone hydrolase
MTRCVVTVACAVALALVAGGCSSEPDRGDGAAPSPDATSSPSTESTDATDATDDRPFAPPTGPGPWAVGRTTVTTSATGGTPALEIEVWYPADPDATGTPSVYALAAFPTMAITSQQALDEVPVADDGPFPLVIYSHGSGGMRFIASFFTETLASHGFVVAAPDHPGDTVVDLVEGTSTAGDESTTIRNRVTDVAATIDEMLDRSADDGDLLADAVDADRIGLTGHSYGGLTAIAAVTGLPDRQPTTTAIDHRVRALVTMDPTVAGLDPRILARVEVPMLTVSGAVDVAPSIWRVQHHAAGELLDVHLPQAPHLAITDICRYQEVIATQTDPDPLVAGYVGSLAEQTCQPPNLATETAHEITTRYGIAWLLVHLAGEGRAEPFLEPVELSEVTVARPERLDPDAPPPTQPLPPDLPDLVTD